MPTYTAPIRDMKFVMQEMLNVGKLTEYERFAEADTDTLDAILEQSGRFSSEVLAPLNVVGDQEGCTRNDDGSVTTPTGFKEAYQQVVEGGMMGLSHDPEYGGMGMPGIWALASGEMQSAANTSFAMYPGLTNGAAKAIEIGGSPEQKKTFLPKMVSGEWTGTMNLTEPHCGTDLGLLKTKAVPQADGSYKITGQKIFISAGEHDMSGNIIHLVLARIEGAPEGVKGISLFIVPKMMNRARLDVGMQGFALSEAAYQNAAAYAKDRLQGRSLTGPKNENGPADPLIVHPDVRRMLMETRAYNEGARALVYWAAMMEDLELASDDEAVKEKCDDLLGLLTPVIKGYLTDMAMKSGHGFIEEWGMSQFVRDTRITLIYEGANGVQALDLVGRKLARKGGRALMSLNAEIDEFLAEHKDNEKVADFMTGLEDAKKQLTEGTMWLMQNGMTNPDNAGAGSTDYMHMMGLTIFAYMWAKMAVVAQAAIDGGSNEDFYPNKLITGRYFVLRMLPQISAHLEKLKTGAEPLMALEAAAF